METSLPMPDDPTEEATNPRIRASVPPRATKRLRKRGMRPPIARMVPIDRAFGDTAMEIARILTILEAMRTFHA